MSRRKRQPEPNEGNGAVGYLRVSTSEQADSGSSLDAQEARIRAYCTLRSLDLVAVIRDPGVSAATPLAARPGGKALAKLVADRGASHIVATKLDRLFRGVVDARNQTETWDRVAVAMHILDMGGQAVDTRSAVGKMFLTVLAAVGEFERNRVGERVRDVLRHKQANGKAVSRAARGLRLMREPDGRNAVAVPDPDSDGLRLVARARALRAGGMTLAGIAAQLAAEGFRPERGRRFYASTVRYMLGNARVTAHVAA